MKRLLIVSGLLLYGCALTPPLTPEHYANICARVGYTGKDRADCAVKMYEKEKDRQAMLRASSSSNRSSAPTQCINLGQGMISCY